MSTFFGRLTMVRGLLGVNQVNKAIAAVTGYATKRRIQRQLGQTSSTPTYQFRTDPLSTNLPEFILPDATNPITAANFAGFTTTQDTGSDRVAVGDMNGDGVDDIAVGSAPGRENRVGVIDGATKQQIVSFPAYEKSFIQGTFVAAGDMTGDGRADLVVTPDQGGGPVVVIYDGAKLTSGVSPEAAQVVRFFGIEDPNFRGGARAAVGKINGDQIVDLVVAAGFGGGPRIAAFDGSTMVKLVPDFYAFEDSLRNGAYPAVGDINADGFGDIVVGAGPGGGPRVIGLSGKDLILLRSPNNMILNLFAGNEQDRGGVRVAALDINKDGRAEVVTGPGPTSSPTVYVLDGLTGTTLVSATIPDPVVTGGYVAGGNITPGGNPQVVVGTTRKDQLPGFYTLNFTVFPPITNNPGGGNNNGGNAPIINLENNAHVSINFRGTSALGFTVSGTNVTVTALSDNPNVVTATLVRNPDGSYGLTLEAVGYGTANVRITARDGSGREVTNVIVVTVPEPVNTPPVIGNLEDKTVVQGNFLVTTSPLPYSDAETNPAQLTVEVTSSNQAVIPNSSLLLFGDSGAKQLRINADAGVGTTTVSLKVTDPKGASTTKSFQVTVLPKPNTPPIISGFPAVTVTAGVVPGAVGPFQVGDAETAPEALTVFVTSGNTAILPSSSLVLGGSGGNRTLTINAPANSAGTVPVTVGVTDAGGLTTSVTFQVTVNPAVTVTTGIYDISLPATDEPMVRLLQAGVAYTVGDFAVRENTPGSGPGFMHSVAYTIINPASLQGVVDFSMYVSVNTQKVKIATGVVSGNTLTFSTNDLLVLPNSQTVTVEATRGVAANPNADFELDFLGAVFVDQNGNQLNRVNTIGLKTGGPLIKMS